MKRLLNLILLFSICISSHAQSLSVTNLRCEYKQDPIGIDNILPHLSWELVSDQKNIKQMAYRIIVSDDPALLTKNAGNIWDSKKVNSSNSIEVSYKGKSLQSGKTYFWKLMVWDNKGKLSGWSKPASWQMGLIQAKDWYGASWIAYEEIADSMIFVPHAHQNGKRAWGPRRNLLPQLRKEFIAQKQIRKATTFISGLGHFELTINGKKVGDHFLDPGWTNYSRHALYVVFDVTEYLQKGSNAIGVMLGNGFYYIPGQRYRKMTGAYGLPKMILRTLIEYTDGTTSDIVSDASWKASTSPIIFSSIFGGEDYDAGMEQANWNKIGFDDSKWKNVALTKGPAVLNAQLPEAVKVMQRFKPITTTAIKPGISVYDFGQNFSGIPSISVKGNKGDTIRIYPAELINEDGSANQRATGSPSYFTYILKGEGKEDWQPSFSYTGFRFLEVRTIAIDSLKPVPKLESIEGLHIRNAAATTGNFNCSNELFNKTYTLIDWAIKSNMVSVFTDCPHREKLGWLEQTYLMGSSVHFAYDISLLTKKMIADMMNAQYADGKIPEITPEFTAFTPPFDESPEWGSASIILPWYNYQWYGDKATLTASYAMMQRYASYLENKSKDHILTHGLGDWYDLGPNRPGFSQMTKAGVTATATYYYDLNILVQVAGLLNKPADVKLYQQKANEVKKAFNQRFFDQQNLKYDSASQTANAMALFTGLVEPANRHAVVNALVKDIRDRDYALTAGDIGYRYLLKALEEAGHSDIIYSMNNRDDVPGYGYQLKSGATALTESWQALPVVSNNHFMLGHIMEWFYAGLCGIKQAKGSIAYNKIEIRPQPVGNITHARASFHSPYGEIVSAWKKTGDSFELEVTIPANTTAIIYLPGNSKPIRTGSGNYRYTIKMK